MLWTEPLGVLQQVHFGILRGLAQSIRKANLALIINACAILYSIITEDERDLYDLTFDYEHVEGSTRIRSKCPHIVQLAPQISTSLRLSNQIKEIRKRQILTNFFELSYYNSSFLCQTFVLQFLSSPSFVLHFFLLS